MGKVLLLQTYHTWLIEFDHYHLFLMSDTKNLNGLLLHHNLCSGLFTFYHLHILVFQFRMQHPFIYFIKIF